MAEVLCLRAPAFMGGAAMGAGAGAGWEKFCGLKKGLACMPNPPWAPPMGRGAAWGGCCDPNWLSHGLGAGVGAGVSWLRVTLGFWEAKRESRADMSGGLPG